MTTQYNREPVPPEAIDDTLTFYHDSAKDAQFGLSFCSDAPTAIVWQRNPYSYYLFNAAGEGIKMLEVTQSEGDNTLLRRYIFDSMGLLKMFGVTLTPEEVHSPSLQADLFVQYGLADGLGMTEPTDTAIDDFSVHFLSPLEEERQ